MSIKDTWIQNLVSIDFNGENALINYGEGKWIKKEKKKEKNENAINKLWWR